MTEPVDRYNPPSSLPEVDLDPSFLRHVRSFGRDAKAIGQNGFVYYTCPCTRTRGRSQSRDYDTIVCWMHKLDDTHSQSVTQCPYCMGLLLED